MRVAVYKGKKYELVWNGATKYGERAKLRFFDGSKEFWVDEALLEDVWVSGKYVKRPVKRSATQSSTRYSGSLYDVET